MKTAYDLKQIKKDILELYNKGLRENIIYYACLNNDINMDDLNEVDLFSLHEFLLLKCIHPDKY